MQDEILDAWRGVLESGVYVLGPQLEAFEREFATYIGAKHCVGVSSGTDALTLILEAIGVEGKEVLVPALTFIATAEAVVHAGATPVFTDVDRDTWCMTGETARPHLSDRTAAVLPVHLFGNPAPMRDFLGFVERGIPVVEDACQAVGSTYDGEMCGSLGDAAAFSFYPSKTLACFGDGGAVVTDDGALAMRVRRLRSHGSVDNRHHTQVGHTNRLDELQAAALRVLLPRLPDRIAAQRARGMGAQRMTPGGVSACHQTVYLGDGPGRSFYQPPCHLQPSMRPYYRGPLLNAERFARANHAEPPVQTPAGPSQTEGGRPAPAPFRGDPEAAGTA